jgi:hypothetical protein
VTTREGGANARGLPAEVERILLTPEAELTPKSLSVLREHFFLTAPELEASAKAIRGLRKPPKVPTTLVMRERPKENPRPTFIHNRGEFLQPTERVEPGVLGVLNPFPADAPRNRLGFARWLVARDHPLTARVVANRAWAAFFGRGLVKTADDFGFQGEAPSHPALLDWLAVEFMENGWSQKKLYRLIVLSATYQQSSHVAPGLIARDPENRLLARRAQCASTTTGGRDRGRLRFTKVAAGHRRQSLPSQFVYVRETHCAICALQRVRCSDRRSVCGPARCFEYAVAGAYAAQ